jgi:CheY-like chemotaxis protein
MIREPTNRSLFVNAVLRSGAVILVAEDHPDSRDALRTLLEAMGHRVLIAVDGREAVARARAEHPSLILMDVMMPEMDGLQATRELRRDPTMGGVPIIALTALEGAREKALDAGCDDYIAKPIDLPAFLKKLEGWISAGRHAG